MEKWIQLTNAEVVNVTDEEFVVRIEYRWDNLKYWGSWSVSFAKNDFRLVDDMILIPVSAYELCTQSLREGTNYKDLVILTEGDEHADGINKD